MEEPKLGWIQKNWAILTTVIGLTFLIGGTFGAIEYNTLKNEIIELRLEKKTKIINKNSEGLDDVSCYMEYERGFRDGEQKTKDDIKWFNYLVKNMKDE